MKKFTIIIVSIVVMASIVVAGFLIFGVDAAKMKAEWGTTKMYVHITENGKEETIGADSKDPFSRYYYTLTAYDEHGKEATVSFSADKICGSIRSSSCMSRMAKTEMGCGTSDDMTK